jgi:hypothetical protein
MNKLESELQRLYFLPGQTWPSLKSDTDNPVIDLITATGLVRCLVISVEQGCDWAQLGALYQGVQEDLDLPAPAISVSVEAGYQIWFSLTEPIGLQSARDFMAGLCQKYLTETKVTKLKFRPGTANNLGFLPLVPAKQAESERWSAFIDPTMGSMFVDETWLEMAPNLDKQAGMLAGLASITADDFQQALIILQSPPEDKPISTAQNSASVQLQTCSELTTLNMESGFTNPKSFLLAVMNNPSASAEHRIQAATVLLPFFAKDSGNE